MKASDLLKRIAIASTALVATAVGMTSTVMPGSHQVAHASTQAEVTDAAGVAGAAGKNHAAGMAALPSPVVVGVVLPPIPDAAVIAYSFAVSHGPSAPAMEVLATSTVSDSRGLLSQPSFSGPTARPGPRPEIAQGMPSSAGADGGSYLMPVVTLISLLVLGVLSGLYKRRVPIG